MKTKAKGKGQRAKNPAEIESGAVLRAIIYAEKQIEALQAQLRAMEGRRKHEFVNLRIKLLRAALAKEAK